jgi:hypothetical protein
VLEPRAVKRDPASRLELPSVPKSFRTHVRAALLVASSQRPSRRNPNFGPDVGRRDTDRTGAGLDRLPGTYPKVTVDQKGRVTGGALLSTADLPSHTHMASDIVSGAIPILIKKTGVDIGTRRALNFIEGSSIGLTVADDPRGEDLPEEGRD